MSDAFSAIEDTKPKNRLASVVDSGIKPTSSMITSADELSIFMRLLLAVEICEVFRLPMSSAKVEKATA